MAINGIGKHPIRNRFALITVQLNTATIGSPRSLIIHISHTRAIAFPQCSTILVHASYRWHYDPFPSTYFIYLPILFRSVPWSPIPVPTWSSIDSTISRVSCLTIRPSTTSVFLSFSRATFPCKITTSLHITCMFPWVILCRPPYRSFRGVSRDHVPIASVSCSFILYSSEINDNWIFCGTSTCRYRWDSLKSPSVTFCWISRPVSLSPLGRH